jgi:hypothetical protein
MGIEPTSPAWKADALPLSYTRQNTLPYILGTACLVPNAVTQSSPRRGWWRGLDSNQRRRTPTGLQPVPFSHSGTPPHKSAEDY